MQLPPHIAGLVSIFFGMCSGAYLIRTLLRYRASQGWARTTGTILESNLEEDSDGWVPHVRYTYAVHGERYTNARLYFYLCSGSMKQAAQKHIVPYPLGKAVTVYYNPRKPEEAVLDRHISLWRPFFWLLFTSFLIFAGVAMLREQVS